MSVSLACAPTLKKPMATARRVSLFARRIEVNLSAAAVDILFDSAAILSEGQVDGEHFFGSTMITFDVSAAAELVAETCDAATVHRLAQLAAGESRVHDRAIRIATLEAQKAAAHRLGDAQVDLRVHTRGTHLHLDLDVEAALATVTK
jgi:hypothetical protein